MPRRLSNRIATQRRTLIDYYINPGVRHKVAKLEIQANRYFDSSTVRERILVMPASFIRYRHGRYSRNAMDRPGMRSRDLYRSMDFATWW